MSTTDLNIVIRAIDRASGVIAKMSGQSVRNLKKITISAEELSRKLDAIGKTAVIAGASITGILGVGVKNAADFESGMGNVSTLIDTNVESMEEMNKKVLAISQRTPVALGDLTSALYDIRSAGIIASDSMNVLEKSARLGIAGIGSTSEAVDLVTSSINAFGLHGKAAEKVYDNIFKTVKAGKTNISQLSQGFGATAGTVAAAGIKLDEYLASVAALTTTGQPASQAHTQIKAAIAGLTRESNETVRVFNKLGATSFNDLIVKSGGMVNAFDKVSQQLNGNNAAILQLFGSTEAFNAVISLTGKQNKAFTDTLAGMRSGADELGTAYEKKLKETNSQMQIAINNIQSMSIAFGTELAPAVTEIAKVIGFVARLFGSIPKPIRTVIAVITALSGVALLFFGTLSLTLSGILSTINLLSPVFAAKLAPAIARAAVASWGFVAPWIAANLPLVGIIAAVGIIAGLGVVLYNKWKPFRELIDGIGNAVSSIGGLAGNLFGGKTAGMPVAESAGAVPKYDVGSTGITKTGLAIVHQGEKILPAGRSGGGSTIIHYSPNLTITGADANSVNKIKQIMKESFNECIRDYQHNLSRRSFV